MNHVLPAWDLLTGAYAAFSLLAAERARQADGQGREVRLPLSDIAMASLGHLGQIAEVMVGGHDRPRLGNALFGAFGRDFRTRDGKRLMVVAITARQWNILVDVLGLTEASKALEVELGVDFASDEGARFIWRNRVYPLFEAAFAARTLEELTPLLDSAGVTHGPYQSLSEAMTTDQRFANNLTEIAHKSGHAYPTPGPAAGVSNETKASPVAAPRLGQHTDEVLSRRLGLSSTAIGRLHDQGLVASA